MDIALFQTIARYLAMIVAGWLVQKGWADESMVEPIVGLAVALAAFAWYLIAKYLPEHKAKADDEFVGTEL